MDQLVVCSECNKTVVLGANHKLVDGKVIYDVKVCKEEYHRVELHEITCSWYGSGEAPDGTGYYAEGECE